MASLRDQEIDCTARYEELTSSEEALARQAAQLAAEREFWEVGPRL